MPLQILGLNHNTAPVQIREQVVFTGDDARRALASLSSLDGVDEAVLLSTCNRTEFYVSGSDAGREMLRGWLLDDTNLDPAYHNTLFTLDNNDAVRHVFRVACGLESMVLGEAQILGQLKDAFRLARDTGTLGPQLNQLMQHTFAVAKKIRTDTEIGASPVSVASAAVRLASQFFSGFQQHTVLLVGAGTTIELVAKHLAAQGIGRIFVANRSLETARELAGRFGGFAVPLSEIRGTLPEADILICSTAASQPVISADDLRAALKQRKRKPIFAIDIAVPRDIEAAAAKLEDVFLYVVDDLERVVQDSQGNREAAALEASEILDDEIARYQGMQRLRQAVPVIAALRDHSESLRAAVLDQAMRRVQRGESIESALEYATGALMKKLLHNPSVALRDAGERSDEALLAAASRLFGLDKDS